MAKNEGSPVAAAVAVTPPPVRRGRKPAEVDSALVDSMRQLLDNGDWAGDGKNYPDKPSANKAIANYKRALKDSGYEGDITSRTWGDDGAIQIALGRKGA